MISKKFVVAAAMAALIAGSSAGMSQTNPDPHHTNQGSAGAADSPSPQAPGMMNMMDMMKMMAMMHGDGSSQMNMAGMGMDAMGGSCMGGMGMTDRVEGRIAFLRAELAITEAQAKLWDTFAGVLRSGAKQMPGSAGPAMMSSGAMGLLEGWEAREKALGACLERVKAERAALVPLFESMTQDQRQTAEELLGPGSGMMGPGMMQGGMMQGGMMQGGMMPGSALPNPQ